MNDAAIPLSRYPTGQVLLACRSCTRKARYAKEDLIQRVGPDESLVTLRLRLAAALGCERARSTIAGRSQAGDAPCGAYYPRLR